MGLRASGISRTKQSAPHSGQVTTPHNLIFQFLRARCSLLCPTNNAKELKATNLHFIHMTISCTNTHTPM